MSTPDKNNNTGDENADVTPQQGKDVAPEAMVAINFLMDHSREIAGYTLTRDMPTEDQVELISDEVGVVAFPKNATADQKLAIVDKVNEDRRKKGQEPFSPSLKSPRLGFFQLKRKP